MSSFAERMAYCVEQAGGRKVASEKFNLSVTAIDKYRRGDSEPNREALERIAKITGVSVRWLVMGEGEPHEKLSSALHIPVYDIELAAGSGVWVERRRELGSIAIASSLIPFASRHLSGYRVRGDSMQPKISDGAVAIIDNDERHSEVRVGGVYAYIHEGHLRLKFLVKQTSSLLIRSFNSDLYPDETVPDSIANDFHIIGKCVGVLKEI